MGNDSVVGFSCTNNPWPQLWGDVLEIGGAVLPNGRNKYAGHVRSLTCVDPALVWREQRRCRPVGPRPEARGGTWLDVRADDPALRAGVPVTLLNYTLEEFEAAPDSLDFIVSCWSMECGDCGVDVAPRDIKKFARWLRPGGRVYICVDGFADVDTVKWVRNGFGLVFHDVHNRVFGFEVCGG